MVLGSRFPMVVLWGPELIQLYNDAYAEILGDRHPAALGQAACVTWAEVWDKIGYLARRTEAVNLDRKRSLMLMLWSIERAVAKAPAAA